MGMPNIFRAGDTLAFSASFDETVTPGNGWSLTYSIRGEFNLSADGVDDSTGNGWIVTFPASKTAVIDEGLYEFIGRVTDGTKIKTMESGFVTVQSNIETAAAGSRLNHVQRMINAINDALEGRITDDVQNFSIAGRSLVHIPVMELYDLRSRYMRELKRLQLVRDNQKLQNIDVVFTARE